MGRADFYATGDWNAICDECGRKYKASTLWKRWDGFMVCAAHWEPRHPQDFVRGVVDNQNVPWSRSKVETTLEVAFSGAAIAINAALYDTVIVYSDPTYTGSADYTVNTPTNPTNGEVLIVSFTQDALYARTITWGAGFTVTNSPTPSQNANASFTFRYNAASSQWVQTSDVQWV